jgi:hypothetical protein
MYNHENESKNNNNKKKKKKNDYFLYIPKLILISYKLILDVTIVGMIISYSTIPRNDC